MSLTLRRGRTLGLVGESGSGKSILLRSIMGLLPTRDVVRSGSVRLDGHELTDYTLRALRRVWGPEIGMVFQDPMTSLNPVKRIGAHLTETVQAHGDVGRAAAQETALALLTSVGIPDPHRRLREYPHQLSGGMRQRVVIALALACGPSLLLADEPTTALDVTVQAQILGLLQRQRRDRDMAMILVTHDLGVVASQAHDIAVMYAGQIVERAPTRVLFHSMRMPYTEALFKSIPRLENPSHTRLATIPGQPPSLVGPTRGCRFAPRCPYAQQRCVEEAPPLRELEPGHEVACWFPVGTRPKTDPHESNGMRGISAADTPAATVGPGS